MRNPFNKAVLILQTIQEAKSLLKNLGASHNSVNKPTSPQPSIEPDHGTQSLGTTSEGEKTMLNMFTGPLALAIRFLLLPIAGWLAAKGFGTYDSVTDTYSVHLESVSYALSGLALWVLTIVWSRIAKKKGGTT